MNHLQITIKSEKSISKFRRVYGRPFTETEKEIYHCAFSHGWKEKENEPVSIDGHLKKLSNQQLKDQTAHN